MPRLEFLKDAKNQDTGEDVKAGEVLEVSDFETGRHLAEGNARLFKEPDRETRIETMTKRRGRKRKDG